MKRLFALTACLTVFGAVDTASAQRWAPFQMPAASFSRTTFAARPGVGVGSIYGGGVNGGQIFQGSSRPLVGGYQLQAGRQPAIRPYLAGPASLSPPAVHPLFGPLSFHSQVRAVINSRLATHTLRPFTVAWYEAHPHSWPGEEAVPANYSAWEKTSWDSLADWLQVTVKRIDYDLKTNEQGELMVHRNGEPWVKAGGRAEAAFKLADLSRTPTAKQEWMPVGTYALLRPDHTDSNMLIHLAVSRNGHVRGSYYDPLMDASQKLTGAIDKKAQRIAWEIGTRRSSVMEAALSSLTEDHAPILVHYNDGFTQSWTMIRLTGDGGAPATPAQPDTAQPKTAQPNTAQPNTGQPSAAERWKALAKWTNVQTAPIIYDYEVDRFGYIQAFRNDELQGLAVYQRDVAVHLADRGKDPGKDAHWTQLGRFALRSTDAEPPTPVQIAIDEHQTLKVSYTDRLSGEVTSFYGWVDLKDQQVAWRMNLAVPVVMQLGLSSLATERASMLAHFKDGWTRRWSIERITTKSP